MVDLGDEFDLGRLERVVGRELDVEEEGAALVRGAWKIISRLEGQDMTKRMYDLIYDFIYYDI